MRIKRHEIDREVCLIPQDSLKDDRRYNNRMHYTAYFRNDTLIGYTQTIRQQMQEAADLNQPYCPRTDVLIWNDLPTDCPHCGTKNGLPGRQHVICLAIEGGLTGAVHLVSRADLTWASVESGKCWKLAKQDPLFMRYFYRTV